MPGARISEALRLLLARQNPDGSFGFQPGQSGWLEPSAWAAMALGGRPEAERLMQWIGSLQSPSGAWWSHPQARRESWATSLVIVNKCLRGEFDGHWRRGVAWLAGAQARQLSNRTWIDRLLRREPAVVFDPALRGWPWSPGTAGWIEPTAHAVRALSLSGARHNSTALAEKIQQGVAMILDRQCRDGGWNYGNRRVLGEDLESFPECTALALIGLCGRRAPQVEKGIGCALQHWGRQPRGLAQALLRIAFRMHGVPFEDRPVEVGGRTETAVLALAVIGEPEGAWRQWKGGTS